jgi:hypothetical protein
VKLIDKKHYLRHKKKLKKKLPMKQKSSKKRPKKTTINRIKSPKKKANQLKINLAKPTRNPSNQRKEKEPMETRLTISKNLPRSKHNLKIKMLIRKRTRKTKIIKSRMTMNSMTRSSPESLAIVIWNKDGTISMIRMLVQFESIDCKSSLVALAPRMPTSLSIERNPWRRNNYKCQNYLVI